MSEPADITKTAKGSIKNAFRTADWWPLVQKDCQRELFYIVDNLELLGQPFRDGFRAACRLEKHRRSLRGQNSDRSGVLFGNRLTDDMYQSAIPATRLLLALDDWAKPNEADVQACRQLCDHIDVLENFGVLPAPQPDVSLSQTIKDLLCKKKGEEKSST